MQGHCRSASHGFFGVRPFVAGKALHPARMKGAARCIGGSTPLPLTFSGARKVSHSQAPDKDEVIVPPQSPPCSCRSDDGKMPWLVDERQNFADLIRSAISRPFIPDRNASSQHRLHHSADHRDQRSGDIAAVHLDARASGSGEPGNHDADVQIVAVDAGGRLRQAVEAAAR